MKKLRPDVRVFGGQYLLSPAARSSTRMEAKMVPGRSHEPRRATLVALLAGALLVATAAAALGAGAPTVRGASSKALGETVAVNPAGHTLYSLSGESSRHLLCESRECAAVWPPLTVPSRATHLKAGAGVHGTLGLIRRPNGSLQVTLRGKPLYRFSGDSGPAQSNGEGIRSFGGVWHAVTASGAAPAPAPPQPPMTPAPEGTPPYSY